MAGQMRVIGSYLSPYVRKVLVTLELKGLAYEVDPIVPFFADDRFMAVSPLRRIPVLLDGDLALSDSSVICQYLEDRWPEPAIYPAAVNDRAWARWLEEYADTRMGDVLIWRLFNEVAIKPSVWGEKGNRERVAKTIAEEVPQVLDYLEADLPASGFRFGPALSIADISIAAFFRTVSFARVHIDAARWPKASGLVERALASPPFQALARFEDGIARTPPAQQRARLIELGAPVSAETYGTDTPRRGIMPI